MLSKEEYINNEINNKYNYNDVNHLLNNLINNKRVIFTKFGDGEGACMLYQQGKNCDNDTYTQELGNELREAFCVLCDMCSDENIYIGKWHSNTQLINFYIDILFDYYINNNKLIKSPPFTDYHFIYPDLNFNKNQNLYNFVDILQKINKYKIIVSNNSNKNLMTIFKGDIYIEIPSNSWYANGEYNNIYYQIYEQLKNNNNGIVLIAGGLASKILIKNLALEFKNASFIDIGSGFDILAKNQYTRAWNYIPNFTNSFEAQYEYFKNLLPNNYLENI